MLYGFPCRVSGKKVVRKHLVLPDERGAKITKEQAQPYPTNGAIIEAHGLTGAIRGKARDGKTGKVLRPDFVLIDDPQSRDSAESVSQTAMRERIIMGDILGLAGPRKKIAAVMPCTVIRKGDLAHRFLDNAVHPEWQGITTNLAHRDSITRRRLAQGPHAISILLEKEFFSCFRPERKRYEPVLLSLTYLARHSRLLS